MKRQRRVANRAQAATADIIDLETGSVDVRLHKEALGTAKRGGVNTLQEGERGRRCQPSLDETLNLSNVCCQNFKGPHHGRRSYGAFPPIRCAELL
jgi:hypothetical protein